MRRDWRRCLLIIGLVAGSARAETPPPFAVAYPLTLPSAAKAYVVELPQDAYAWARRDAGLGDVVVVDAKDRQVAAGLYAPAPPTAHPVTLDAPLLPVPQSASGVAGARIQRSTNGDIVIEPGAAAPAGAPTDWLFDARQPVAPERLEFAPSTRDVDLRVDVDASTNLQDWTPLVRGATVVTLGQGDGGVDARVVKLSGNAARYYRVHVERGEAPWADGEGSKVTLSGTVEDAAAKDEAARRWLDVASTGTVQSGQGVDYDYRLPAALPVTALRVRLGKGDTVARFDAIAVEGSMSGEQLGTLVVTPPRDSADAHPLDVAAGRREMLRLHSATPLREPPHLLVGWQPDRIVFLPEGDAPYRLLVGSHSARRPAWPIADAIAALRKDAGPTWRPAQATPGKVQELAGRKALDPAEAPFDWTRPLLWVVLLLGAAVVAAMAASLLRKPKA
ncbi:DUF3999 family protein [Luteibacter yeojuensis]|uniref:DUF3999 domain-containing protein n=1 Tax=Luteibacter yeojuensis TaxID=345309 RepID=A0A7X5QSA6_9GAMM|nr:DUF3999 family protein [Luteibacter yeojuensis]NID14486.1 DUF3999 domain-containing protein [Luteibacter yeojuensis]